MTCKPFIVFLLFALSITCVFAQKTASYWQQEVNYKINVTLNDRTNELDGNIAIEYINHSPDALPFIWIHLWPNAYKNANTAFAKQEVENGDTRFFYSKLEQKGYIDKLDFKVNDDNVQFAYDSVNIDIGKITLSQPLKSGEKITITTPFHVKLPFNFSRSGYSGSLYKSYQVSQWYPKPAVYDAKGWHPIPYLDQGEFYSEFGSYDVNITLPDEYVVGSTGDLQNREEIKWLEAKSASTKKMFNLPMNEEEKKLAEQDIHKWDDTSKRLDIGTTMKTLHYTQQRIHDFAWFANKDYYVLKSEVVLPHTGSRVDTWLMFTNRRAELWKNAMPYIDSSIYYYSKWLGDYPYKQVTAVEGALQPGAGGMEYPNVTVIGDNRTALSLEVDIAHEVGHNWLYGVLGFNERDYPWMDEGINSYYENRYIETRYPGKMFIDPNTGLAKFFDLKHLPYRYMKYLAYMFQQRRHEDQAANLPSTAYSAMNYYAIIYNKTPDLLIHLAAYLGQQQFDTIMQRFYEDWKFKHPQPEDFKHQFVSMTNVDLDWFFEQGMKTTRKLDYKMVYNSGDTTHIAGSHYIKITVKNKGGVKAPYSISAIKKDQVVSTQWYGGFTGKMTVLFPDGDYDKFKIDAGQNLWESDRQNNTFHLNSPFPTANPPRIQLFGSLENPNRNQLFVAPAGGWNNYNGPMLGLVFYNSFIPAKNFEYQLVPMYAFSNKKLVGIGRVAYHFYPGGSLFHEIVLSAASSHFRFDSTRFNGATNFSQFNRLSGRLDFNLHNQSVRSKVDKGFTLRSIYVTTSGGGGINALASSKNIYTQFSFHLKNNRMIDPYSFAVTIENGNGLPLSSSPYQNTGGYQNTEAVPMEHYTKLFVEGNYRVNYNSKSSGLSVRIFAGTEFYASNDLYEPYHLGATTGQLDYRFDEVYLGRSEMQGLLSQQFALTDGGMKFRSSYLINPIGVANSIFAVNLRSSLPVNVPVFLFYDLGVSGDLFKSLTVATNYTPFQFDGGVGVTIIPGVCEVYLPLIFSKDIKTNLNTIPAYDKWYKRILFTLNISKLNPIEKVRHFEM